MGQPSDTITEIAAKPEPKLYRKTALIQAVQFNKPGDHPEVIATEESPTGYALYGLENTKIKHEVTLGDWIASSVGETETGKCWAIKPDFFAANYEESK